MFYSEIEKSAHVPSLSTRRDLLRGGQPLEDQLWWKGLKGTKRSISMHLQTRLKVPGKNIGSFPSPMLHAALPIYP